MLYVCPRTAKRFFSKYFQILLRRAWGWDLHIDDVCYNSVGFVSSSVLQATGDTSLSIRAKHDRTQNRAMPGKSGGETVTT